MTANLAPPGVVLPYAGSAAPSSWLLCDGSAVSRTTYADLFAAISTAFGTGDGSTTFNLPDMKGRIPAGKEATATRLTSGGSGVDGATLGAVGGTETHTLTAGQIPAHAHPINNGNSYYLMRTSGGAVGLTGGTGLADTVSNTSNNTGGGSAHPNVQPTIVLNYIIKT
jgi:microcystin-dependent protein